MKSVPLILTLLLSTLLIGTNLGAEDPFGEMDKAFDVGSDAIDKKWQEADMEIDAAWDEYEQELERKWTAFQKEVEKKWEGFVRSTKKDWVEYSKGLETRSKVDFKKGEVVIETIIPGDDPKAFSKAREKINKQAKRMLAKEDITGKKVLENQIVNKKGEKVTRKNQKKFIKEEILPNVKPDPKPFKSRDGVKRRKYSVSIDLVPEQIKVRAEKYLPLVEKGARRFLLKPQLVLAIIQTESYFNPLAVSSCNAIGLMQIIPRFAGREAYKALYNTDKVLKSKYLFNPKNNIELGCKYLSLLKYNHFRDVRGDVKNRYVSICGYNWGPTVMRRKIVDRYPISQMADSEVYSLLRNKTPKETRNYIKRVTERMPIYDPYF